MILAAELFRPDIGLLALEASRIGGVIAVAPIPWSNAPQKVRVGLILFLVALVHNPDNTAVGEVVSAGWAAAHISTELIIGGCIGLIIRMSIGVAEIAGNAVATPMGFGAAQVFDPTVGSTDSALTRVFRSLALMLAISVGLHRVMLGVLVSSFRTLPVGSASNLEATFPLFLEFSGHIIEVGVQMALPLLSVLLMANVALGFVARAAPTMQIFNVGFAVLLATGGAVLLLSLPEIGREMVAEMGRNTIYFERLIAELSAP